MNKYATTYILIASLVIGEFHTFWEGTAQGVEMQNWILRAYKPMTVQWNIKYLSNQVLPILYFLAMWFYRKNPINNTTVKTFIVFCCIDLIMYFYNFKTYEYGKVYLWVVLIWVLFFWGKRFGAFIWRHIKSWGKP